MTAALTQGAAVTLTAAGAETHGLTAGDAGCVRDVHQYGYQVQFAGWTALCLPAEIEAATG